MFWRDALPLVYNISIICRTRFLHGTAKPDKTLGSPNMLHWAVVSYGCYDLYIAARTWGLEKNVARHFPNKCYFAVSHLCYSEAHMYKQRRERLSLGRRKILRSHGDVLTHNVISQSYNVGNVASKTRHLGPETIQAGSWINVVDDEMSIQNGRYLSI